jgi:hypothetical protein
MNNPGKFIATKVEKYVNLLQPPERRQKGKMFYAKPKGTYFPHS